MTAIRNRGVRYGAAILIGAVVLFVAILSVFRLFDLFPRNNLVGTLHREGQHLPAFQLADQRSEIFGSPSLRGHVSLVAPIYTHSAATAPVVALKLREAYELLGGRARDVQLIGISIDPDRDTVANAAAFSRELGLYDTWHYLTGTKVRLAPLWRVLHLRPVRIDSGTTTIGTATDQMLEGLSPEYATLAKSVSARFGTGFQLDYRDVIWVLDVAGRMRVSLEPSATPIEIAHDVESLLAEVSD